MWLGYHAGVARIPRWCGSDTTLVWLGYHAGVARIPRASDAPYFRLPLGRRLAAAKWRCWLLVGTVRT